MPNPDAPVASAQELSSNTAEEEMTATDDDVNSLLAIDESVSEEPGQVTTNFKNCKVYHYTKATISNDGWNQIKNLFDDSGVNASTTIYSVDIANLVLTETRAQSFVDDDTSELHELCSNIFDEEEPEWMVAGESMGCFEMELRIGCEYDVFTFCERHNIEYEKLDEILSDTIEGSGSTQFVNFEVVIE